MRNLALLALIAACGGSQPARPAVEDRIPALANAVEHGVLPPVQVVGEDVRWTLAERMAHHKIPGLSIAVFEDHRLVWAHAYGVTEAGGTTPVTTSTLFQAASISKSVNAAGVLMAVDDGTLSLDAPVNTLLKTWQLPDNELTAKTPVTIRHLLSHTGGTTVGGFPGYAAGAPVPTLLQVLDGLPPANTGPIRVDLAPGAAFSYSGGGITITQLALVDNLGQPYPALMRERVLAPLGMTASTFEQPLPDARVVEAASGTKADGSVVPGERHVYPEMAAAGLWTTPTDLCAFFAEVALARAGRSKVLTQELATQMTTGVAPVGDGMVGIGVFLTDHRGAPVFGHGGANEGFQSNATASLDDGFGVVIMVNSDNGSQIFPEVERTVWAAMGWPGVEQPVARVPLDAEAHDRFAGSYQLPDGPPFSIVADGEGLRLALPLDDSSELVPVGPDELIDRVGAMRFVISADGSLAITPPGGEPTAIPRLDPAIPHPLLELAAGRGDAAVAAWTPGILAEATANVYGYELLIKGRVEGAVAVFRLIVARFPESSNAFDSLADGLVAAGDTGGAIAAYEQALAKLDADPGIPAEQKPARRAYEEGRIGVLRGD